MAEVPHPHQSLWIATTPGTDWPSLDGDIDVDVAVVGAGITGISVAWRLKQAGKRVALLDAGTLPPRRPVTPRPR